MAEMMLATTANSISNKAILNTMTSIKLAGEAINNLANRIWEES